MNSQADANLSINSNMTSVLQKTDTSAEKDFESLKSNHILFQKLQGHNSKIKKYLITNIIDLLDMDGEISRDQLNQKFGSEIEQEFQWIIQQNHCSMEQIYRKILNIGFGVRWKDFNKWFWQIGWLALVDTN